MKASRLDWEALPSSPPARLLASAVAGRGHKQTFGLGVDLLIIHKRQRQVTLRGRKQQSTRLVKLQLTSRLALEDR